MPIAIRGISHSFRRRAVLKDVSLTICDGDCYGLLGHNGAGKTTLLRILLGLEKPRAGRISVDGHDIMRSPREARALLGSLSETPTFFDGMTGQAELRITARLRGLSSGDAAAEALKTLDRVGLNDVGKKPIRAYSQGMRRRLGLARALIGSPRYLVLDEPMNGLDPEGMAEVRDLLADLRRESGLTILLSSHLLSEIESSCNRVAIMRQGEVLLENEVQSILNSQRTSVRIEGPKEEQLHAALTSSGYEPKSSAGIVRCDVPIAERPALLARLILDGHPISAFSPETPTLEQFYLAVQRGGQGDHVSKELTAETAPSGPRIKGAFRRALDQEIKRGLLRGGVLFLFAIPSGVAVLAVLNRAKLAASASAEVARRELATTTSVTAFEGIAFGLIAGLPLLALVLAGFASQIFAADFSRGTLRTLLVAPLKRVDLFAAKIATLLVAAALGTILLYGATWITASTRFEFEDLYEILANGKRFPRLKADEVWPDLWRALWAPLPALVSVTAIGALSSALVRSATLALSLSLGSILILDLSRAVLRPRGLEGLTPTTYLPSPLGDRSFLQYFADLSQGLSNATFAFASTEAFVPWLWTIPAILLAYLLFRRRPVP